MSNDIRICDPAYCDWERDQAIQQLEELGVSLGSVAHTPHTCFYCTHRSTTHSCSDGQCRVVVFCKLTGDETSNGATCPEWEERKEKC